MTPEIAHRVALQNRPLPAYNFIPAGRVIPNPITGGPSLWQPAVPSPLPVRWQGRAGRKQYRRAIMRAVRTTRLAQVKGRGK